MKSVAVCVLSFLFVAVAGRVCQDKWQYFDRHCYWFSDIQMSWVDAQNYCQFFGASLAEIESPAENLFIKTSANSSAAVLGYFLGGTDMFDEGFWVWASTNRQIYKFSDWDRTQPDGSIAKNCLALWRDNGHRWGDVACNTSYHFICEIEADFSAVIVG